jgi:ATP phosphoribosyltransferase
MNSLIKAVFPDGSMEGVVKSLMAKAGMPVVVRNSRTKIGEVEVEWIKSVVFQRPQEIPIYLNNGHFDIAIVGEDWIANWGYKFPVLLKLPIGRSGNKPVRIILAVSQDSGINMVEDLPKNSEVATEYVQLVQRFFVDLGRDDIKVVPSYGNTEHKIRFGATAIVDVTESGNSLKENGLKVIHEVMESSTVVVARQQSLDDKNKAPYINCFMRLIKGAFEASQSVMLTANVPEKMLEVASKFMGGLKGASRSPLAKKGWFALQSIVPKKNEQEIIFDLLQIDVTDIIVKRDIPLIMS